MAGKYLCLLVHFTWSTHRIANHGLNVKCARTYMRTSAVFGPLCFRVIRGAFYGSIKSDPRNTGITRNPNTHHPGGLAVRGRVGCEGAEGR